MLLGVVVTLGGAAFTWAAVAELPSTHFLCQIGFCGPGVPTTTTEPTNPFGWSDLAEQKAAAGDIPGARSTFQQAIHLGPNVPPILIRYVNFEVAGGDFSLAVPHIQHILELTPAYDSVLFRYLVRSGLPAQQILNKVIPDPGQPTAPATDAGPSIADHASAPNPSVRPPTGAARGWVAYLIGTRHESAADAFAWLDARHAVTPELRNQWIDYLVSVRRAYPQAMAVWAAANTDDGYPGANRVFNSRFAPKRPASRLNWTIHSHPHVVPAWSDGLALTFDGFDNTAYSHLSQQTYIPPGRWRFTADIQPGELTTDQRPFFRIYDMEDPRRLDASTPMTPDKMTVDFTVPAAGSWAVITLNRRQSEKFDNKIRGVLRLRSAQITPIR